MYLFNFYTLRHIFFALAITVLCTPPLAHAATFKLTLVLSERGGAYAEYANALGSHLETNKNILVSLVYADQLLPDSDLVIAAGMKASQAAIKAGPAAVLAVLIPREGMEKLLSENPAYFKSGAKAYSAIYLDQPIRRQLDLISSALPGTKSIAVLYAKPPAELGTLRSLAMARKIELNARSLTSAGGLYPALQELLASSDVLLATPDAEIYNTVTIRNILLATYRSNVPLVGFSPAYVKAGALCAVYTTPEQLAAQSAGIVQEFTERRVLPVAQYAKEFEVSINEHVARSLGLNIKSASQLHDEMRKKP